MIRVTAKKQFSSPKWGNIVPGDRFDVELSMARQLREADLIEEVETDPMGKQILSSALQAVQVSPKPSPITSGSLEKKANAESLQSIPVSEPQGQTSSTDATGDGGKSTTKKPRKKRTSGPKTSGQPMN